jgi:hypothetical protein
MTIEPTGGLANRLRVIFSYRELARQKNEKLLVSWTPNESCDGFFEDFFEPIDIVAISRQKQENLFYRGCSPYKISFNYSQLRLNKNMQNKLNARLKVLDNDFTAAHLRKTDLIQLLKIKNKPIPNDDEFLNFFRSKQGKYFLATDNAESQNKFKKLLGDSLIVFDVIENTSKLRQTTLETSILDLYTCVFANEFKGTIYSSYTDLIIKIRNDKHRIFYSK